MQPCYPIPSLTTAPSISRSLLGWLRRQLQYHIRLDAPLVAQMETTFGTSDVQQLQAAADDSETAAFLCLLFSPDMRTQTAYEDRWGDQRFAPATVDGLIAALTQTPIEAVVAVDTRAVPLRLTVPHDALEGFVRRLRIDWQPPVALAHVLQRLKRDPAHLPTRAGLRHARLQWHAKQVNLLDRLLTGVDPAEKDFETLFTFLLSLLSQLAPDEDPFVFLMAQKRFYFQCLGKAAAFERRHSAGNMEILMLQGARASYGSVDHWRRCMARIDRLAIALFGHTEAISQG
ncbi:hypothetical protein [Desulfatitalea alkaliphila]|uniref:Uncharacterized protein n=1 Tax=Desulfatitalea alkaliphila TaxID=2929485 RepID=A0AA41R2J9_9BACT|nr:hypothetical protein [Desulfatitalea alkaliphila]MCJ8500919.1 hypothetical protein [Desulfatitalea alkaliphila]